MRPAPFFVTIVLLAACASDPRSTSDPVATAPPTTDPPSAPPAAPAPAPPPAAACPTKPVDVVVYTEDGWNELGDAFARNPSACADYFISLPSLANDKTKPRGPVEPANMRKRGSRFHPMAEFHWGGWSAITTMSWYEKGVAFRQAMIDLGYDVAAGDVWEINELPSTVRHDETTRANAREAIKGLYDGPPGSPKVMGAVFVVGMGQGTTNLGPYKTNIGGWLADDAFWSDVAPRVRFWGQETYGSPLATCVDGAPRAAWSAHIDAFTEHVAILADAAPGGAAPKSFLAKAYTPLANAAWKSAAYTTESMTLEQMEGFVSMQVYAARAWASAHPRPRDTVGFGWVYARDGVSPSDIATLGDRLAGAIHGAWSETSEEPSGACDAGKQTTWCSCAVPGAAFNDAWKTFATY
jgi:hypothetical protein